jgi:hypothetical protein
MMREPINPAGKQRDGMRSGAALKTLIARTGGPDGVDLEPGCAYGVVTRTMVQDLTHELREIKGRVNQLLFLTIGTIILEVMYRITGLG